MKFFHAGRGLRDKPTHSPHLKSKLLSVSHISSLVILNVPLVIANPRLSG
jgi:hypothetical protein